MVNAMLTLETGSGDESSHLSFAIVRVKKAKKSGVRSAAKYTY